MHDGTMPDAPNPAAGAHEHLFTPEAVAHARSLSDAIWAQGPFVRACQICEASVDLVTGQPPDDAGQRSRW